MSKNQNQEISKFLSYILRHQPESIGLSLDQEGWADIDLLIHNSEQHGKQLTRSLLEHIVQTSDKKRFAISEDGQKIRAVQGHSNPDVDIQFKAVKPPELLFHGTASRFIDSILSKGLVSGSRQYVHLSSDLKTAISVGQRHGKPVVLIIKAQLMDKAGFKFYLSENGVWLTEHVPVDYLSMDSNNV